ncbi:MAG TPA: hypothetical protein VGN90_09260 [Pyrinomonadaceae bacterium]|jgi:hypothetical protein|nr:hypothetical protein [Pyrinomonadaceae bacterium]
MTESVSHSFADESMAAKAKWFRTLSIEDRMNMLIEFTNLILENNPEVAKKKHARPASDRVRVLELANVRKLTAAEEESDSED